MTTEEYTKYITDSISGNTEAWEVNWALELSRLIISRMKEAGHAEDDCLPLVPIITVLLGICIAHSEAPDSSFDRHLDFSSALSKEVAMAIRDKYMPDVEGQHSWRKTPDVGRLN